jgi:hypothetical protein
MILATLPPSFPLYAFVLSLVGYCFGRLVLAWIASGAKKSNLRHRTISNNAAELDNAYQAKRLAEEERFELEKRAFFSKVCLLTRTACGSRIFRCSLEALELTMTVMAFGVPSKQIHQAWRLPYFLLRRYSVLHSPRSRPEASSVPQRL